METITLEKSILRALAHFVSTDDLIPAMTGILLEPADGGIWVTATDAHIMGGYFVEDQKLEKPAILPAKDIKDVIKKDRYVDKVTIRIKDSTDAELEETGNGRITTVKLVDERYPGWKAVIPTETSLEGSPFMQLDPDLQMRIYKAGHELGYTPTVKNTGTKQTIPPTIFATAPNRAALVQWEDGPEFFALIMPITRKTTVSENWVYLTKLNGQIKQ